jgi:hypothetical protein
MDSTYHTTDIVIVIPRLPAGVRHFTLLHIVKICSGAQYAVYSMSTECSMHGLKRQGREADHSPASTVEVKNGGAINSIPPHAFMA